MDVHDKVEHLINKPSAPPNVGASPVANATLEAPAAVVDQFNAEVSHVPLTGLAPVPAGPPQNLFAASAVPAVPAIASTVTIFFNNADRPEFGTSQRDCLTLCADVWDGMVCFMSRTLGFWWGF